MLFITQNCVFFSVFFDFLYSAKFTDTKKNTIRFDILSEADGKVTTNENGTWKDSSIVNWYGVSDTKFYAEPVA